MFSVVLIVLLAGALVAASVRLQQPDVDHRVTALLLGNYFLRLAIAPFTRSLNVFTSAATDSSAYEACGEIIARLWRYTGIHYVRGDEMPTLQDTSLPPNIFALITYLNGEPTHLGCTAVVAAAACFVCLELYLIARLLGVRPNMALSTAALVGVLPSFLFYTSNTYKDGFVSLFVIGILGCAIRLARAFSVRTLAWAVFFSVCLWLTRFYLLFIVPAPLLLGVLGLRSRSIFRTALAVLVVAASVSALYAYSRAPDAVAGHATRTFATATSQDVLNENAQGGSGVTFDSTSPVGSFVPKLLYTLFSPFPWQSGSLGLQIAKVEALVWYYFFYRAARAARAMWRDHRSDLLMFISLVAPLTVAYTLSFSNIGLIMRQRMGIVITVMLMASLSWKKEEGDEEEAFVRPASNARDTRRIA
jgi:hypothetical protein